MPTFRRPPTLRRPPVRAKAGEAGRNCAYSVQTMMYSSSFSLTVTKPARSYSRAAPEALVIQSELRLANDVPRRRVRALGDEDRFVQKVLQQVCLLWFQSSQNHRRSSSRGSPLLTLVYCIPHFASHAAVLPVDIISLCVPFGVESCTRLVLMKVTKNE